MIFLVINVSSLMAYLSSPKKFCSVLVKMLFAEISRPAQYRPQGVIDIVYLLSTGLLLMCFSERRRHGLDHISRFYHFLGFCFIFCHGSGDEQIGEPVD